MISRTRLVDALAGAPEEAAPSLLGAHLVSNVGGVEVRVRINEVEAYKGEDDPASHAYRGRTLRNGSMFERPGTLYVYRSYGIHNCANSAAGPEGVGWGILIRGGEVVEGQGIARSRRGRSSGLANGPGKLCQALGIDLTHNGTYLFDPDSVIHLEEGDRPEVVMATPRIGITRAQDRPWRFVTATQLSA
ncbi:MAG TPA: DNA-3-methyladenine glycosylase [Acidimicrobiia bacterium]|nr:DNA-3-methyladenine glycosylase [Acidimicrobiia bacterium]